MRELLFAYLTTRPEFARPKSCRTKLVGPMRQFLWRHGGAQNRVVTQFWPDAPPRALALIAERTDASAMLADFCIRCGRCPLSKEFEVMATPRELRVLSPAPDTDPDADHER
jgi:hypothetical protein